MLRSRPFVAAVLAGSLAAGAVAAVLTQGREVDTAIRSVALAGKMHALIVLPAGYGETTERYPVVYFLHGLPATPTAYAAHRWLERALAAVGPAILVEPQGARKSNPDPEYLNWGPGRDWATFVTRELPAYVDAHYRTIGSRRGRALIGLSAGGYGATELAFTHLDRFSVVESWSGYFHPTDPTGTKAIAAPPGADVHRLIATLAADERRRPTFFAFYVGSGDQRFRAENEQLNRELDAAHVPHVFTIYPGAHSSAVWEQHARAWLAMALRHLAKPQA